VIAMSDWNDTLRVLELALASGDPNEVARVAVAATLGPIPADLAPRAGVVLAGIRDLESSVEDRLGDLAQEMDRRPTRSRWTAPPAPSQLDCSA